MTQNPVAALQPLASQASVVIVLVDDAAHLQAAWGGASAPAAANTHWLLVACAPRMAQRPSKWGSHRVREHWRARWSAKLFEEVGGWMQARGQAFTPLLAEGPLPEFTQALMGSHGATQVVDLRRPKGESFGAYAPVPAAAAAPAAGLLPPANRLWSIVASLLGVSLLLGGIAE